MLSYRINFYVALHSLAEQLVSGYLRFITDINLERTLLQTLQPSEPILAYTSAREMTLHPHKRLDAVKALCANSWFQVPPLFQSSQALFARERT